MILALYLYNLIIMSNNVRRLGLTSSDPPGPQLTSTSIAYLPVVRSEAVSGRAHSKRAAHASVRDIPSLTHSLS